MIEIDQNAMATRRQETEREFIKIHKTQWTQKKSRSGLSIDEEHLEKQTLSHMICRDNRYRCQFSWFGKNKTLQTLFDGLIMKKHTRVGASTKGTAGSVALTGSNDTNIHAKRNTLVCFAGLGQIGGKRDTGMSVSSKNYIDLQ